MRAAVIQEKTLVTAIRGVDAYHSCYNIAGLSSAQHTYHPRSNSSDGQTLAPLTAAFQWTFNADQVIDHEDTVGAMHPVYVIPWGVAERSRAYFESKQGF